MEKQGIYAYAVVSNSQSRLDSPSSARRVKTDNIFLARYKDLTLVGETVDIADFQKELQEALINPKTMEGVLTEHQNTLDRLMRETTVVPFQFGTILKDKEGAVDHLKSSYASYKELLKKFKDRQEWGVRVFADLKKFKTSLSQFNPETKEKLGSGTAYLLRRKQEEEVGEATNEKLVSLSGEILNNLKELAFDYKVTKSAQRLSEKGELLISVFALLLDKSQIRKFSQKLAKLEKKYQEFGLEITSSGPWPAYNFVSPASPER